MKKPRILYLRTLASTAAVLLTALPLLAAEERADGEPGPNGWGGSIARVFTVDEVIELMLAGDGPVMVDARSRKEYRAGHIPGAVSVPHKETWGRIAELEQYRERGIIYYGKLGARAGIGSAGATGQGRCSTRRRGGR